jgi:hypothetical protein
MKANLGGVGSRKIEAFEDGSALNLLAEMTKVSGRLMTIKLQQLLVNLLNFQTTSPLINIPIRNAFSAANS